MATDPEVLALIRQAGLAGSGIGYVDAQLLTAARLSPDACAFDCMIVSRTDSVQK